MRKIIITDLTRFSDNRTLCTAGIDVNTLVCTAGIDVDTLECIRPLPYLQANRCREWNILPGAILTGNFSPHNDITMPHLEGMDYQDLKLNGYCASNEFREILHKSLYPSIEDGFEVSLGDYKKCILQEANPARSLITISVNPQSVQIVQDTYNTSKIKAHITDTTGKDYRFLPVADFGLHEYAKKHRQEIGNFSNINNLINSQKEVFLRIGLGRFHEAPNGRAGFWIQVNGIYSFPEYFEAARRYE